MAKGGGAKVWFPFFTRCLKIAREEIVEPHCGCRVTSFEPSERAGRKAWAGTHAREARRARLAHLLCLGPEGRSGAITDEQPGLFRACVARPQACHECGGA